MTLVSDSKQLQRLRHLSQLANDNMADIDRIYLRAKIGEKWDSLSIQELISMGEGGQVFEWGLEKINKLEGVVITEENMSQMVDLMRSFGIPVHEIKKEI